ncbi:MAG: hypothetical protein ABWZ80_01650 [Beijerinckiaceae bacterium]
MATSAMPSSDFKVDENLERLIAETLGVGRMRAFPETPTHEKTVRLTSPLRAQPPVPQPGELTAPVEPLNIAPRSRPRSRALAPVLAAAGMLAVGGWWIGTGGLDKLGATNASSNRVAAVSPSPGAAPAPIRQVDAPAVVAPASVPTPSRANPGQVAAAPPPQPEAPPRPATPPTPPPTDSAGILGSVQSTPFDQPAAPKPVRTTQVIPPTPPVEATPKQLDFDDPSTWPSGAVKGEPHPLPPRRATR